MLLSALIWIRILSRCVRSIPIGCGQPRPRRHSVGRDYEHPSAHLRDQFAQIVEEVIDFRVTIRWRC
jgi:hypothetical protein